MRCSLALCCARPLVCVVSARVCCSLCLLRSLCMYMYMPPVGPNVAQVADSGVCFVRLVLQRNSAFFDVCSCCTHSRTHTPRTRARLHKKPEREATTASGRDTATKTATANKPQKLYVFFCVFLLCVFYSAKKVKFTKIMKTEKKLNWL